MKIRELYIEDYKMFKDFKIDFVDKNKNPLPIIILAGVNGSGKTTLLECLNVEIESNIDIQTEFGEINLALLNDKMAHNYFTVVQDYSECIEAFPSGIDDIKNVADEFVKTFYYFLKDKDYRSSEITEHFSNYMKDIFDNLDIGFKYSHLDKDDNVWFSSNTSLNQEYYYTAKNNDLNIETNLFKIKDLSTGEKTLLSKVLYLYFKDYKDKVILIDEPELSLHPSWQNRVLKIYENFAKLNNCQIIITTHSPHIIGSAKNEYLRILTKNREGNIKVIKDLKAEGRDINSILFDIMGEVEYRPKEFDEKIDRLHIAIDDKKFNEANQRLDELKRSYGKDDAVVIEAQMLIDMFSEDE